MTMFLRLCAAASIAMLSYACASYSASKPRYPVSHIVIGEGQEPRVEKMSDDNARHWHLPDLRDLPISLSSETIRVINGPAAVYMDEPLCQAVPTLHVTFPYHGRWGKSLYENFSNNRRDLLNQVELLVEANCKPGVVQTVDLAAFALGTMHTIEDSRFLDRYDAATRAKHAVVGRYVYYGLIDARGPEYQLIHQDPDGLARYMATNAGNERQFASMEEGQRLQRQLEEGGLGQIVADYCTQNPIVCASWAAVVLKGGGGDASPKFKQCQDTCTVTQQPSLVAHCQATCYQYINR